MGNRMSKTPAKSTAAPMYPDRPNGLEGLAATIAAAAQNLPHAVFAEPAGPETEKAVLGYFALTDAAPLIIAKEKG